MVLPDEEEAPNNPGIIAMKMGLSVGKHAANTPVVSSKNDHVAASTLSYVGSCVVRANPNVLIR